MKTLYLCGAGNPEGVRLALNINQATKRWDQIIVLDDDPAKQGRLILGVKVEGPFTLLEQADPASAEVSNLVARTTKGRQSVRAKIQAHGLSIVQLIAPGVDISWVKLGKDITIYSNALCYANSTIEEGSVVFGGAIVGHGSHVGPCCVLAPGAVVNARVQLDEGVYVGTNASVLPDVKVGAWATIGGNSLVIKDVPPGTTVMGVPAQVIVQPDDSRSDEFLVANNGNRQEQEEPADSTRTQPIRAGVETDAMKKLRTAQENYIEAYRGRKKTPEVS
jgi:sugar O-acyltransferase (sialic acid O-acetyltransferase NeuD family)